MVTEWLRRYGLAECAGVVGALIASALVRRATGNTAAAAYAGAWGETIGYASVIAARDVSSRVGAAGHARVPWSWRHSGHLIRDWIAEFGPAGILDTFVTRPLTMGLGMRFFGPVRGLVAGKLVADVIFYLPVIAVYERRVRLRRR